MPDRKAGYWGPKKHNRVGVGISIALHVALLAYVLFSPSTRIVLKPPAKEGEMVWVAPLAEKPKSKPAPKPEPTKSEPVRQQRVAKAVSKPAPAAPRQEVYVPPVQAPMQTITPVQEEDMQARVEAARKRRAQENPQPQQAEPEESEAQRASRVARANIMGAQGRNAAGEREETGGVFQILNRTSLSADFKFRGWNTNFKRQWLQQYHVEVGADPDIETAIVRKMIEVIRKEKPGEFEWDSQRLGRTVKMNASKPFQAELEAFLMKEMFPEYRRARG
ncbi:MAG: hypothetical protein K2X55_05695 [Burkholderiaceae bacterium]|nr:hypothetical protein [Burkholderiaceae bacterium]